MTSWRWFLALPLVVVACGGGGDESGLAPSELVGAYTTALEKADIPANQPPELTNALGRWELTFANKGGPDDGPTLLIASAEEGSLESPAFSIDGDRLLLHDEECGAGGAYAFYDNEYRWRLEGRTLFLTTVVNQCPDHVAETVITSHPWTKTA